MLRFGPNGATVRVDGGRPKSRGRPPAGRQCRRPVPSARWSRKTAPRAGGGLASFRFCSGGKAHTRRTAQEQGPSACGGWEREAAPLAVYSRTQAPRAGGLGASLRSEWGDGAGRRRTAHEQGPSACGSFGRTGRWGNGVRFPAFSSPKTPQAASPCSWACRRLCARPPHSDRNAAHPPPARGAGVRQLRANGTGRPHCGHLPTQKLAKMASMTASEASRPVTLSRRAQALSMSGATTSGLNPS